MKDEIIYIESILESIENIFDFIKGYSFERYIFDTKTKMAVERSLENIGEAVKKLSTSTKSNISLNIAWREISGMRDILVHDYLCVDDDIVWEVLLNKLPDLRLNILEYLKTKII